MLPKEHGAYGQISFPLVTSLAVAGLSWPSVFTAVAVIAMFLAHEPLLVLLGHRGRRSRSADSARAWWWLKGALVAGTASAIVAVDSMPAELRWTFLVPAVPAVWLFYAAIYGREKTSIGETAAAIAFAASALPICAGAGRPDIGIAIAVAFALLFVLATLAVRVIVLRTRGGGDPRAAARMRGITFTLAAVGTVIALTGATDGLFSWGLVAAIVPGIAFVSAIAAFPPPAARLKKVGWTLVAVSALTSVLLIAVA